MRFILFLFLTITSTSPTRTHTTTTTKDISSTLHKSSKPATCPYRSVNYISNALPQQCPIFMHSQIQASHTKSANISAITNVTATTLANLHQRAAGASNDSSEEVYKTTSTSSVQNQASPATQTAQATDDTDSPLDASSFLSFEEWKAQNLARSGQTAEDAGGKPVREVRKKSGMLSALDAIGEDAEIELNFDTEDDGLSQEAASASRKLSEKPVETPSPESHARSKDAGKTCKERFNYASDDCAATVHKSNKEAKGVSKILIENKDSYMLNKCGAPNKFIIIELCDEILVDTIVLANYEFFSSMFRTFRVSVSDRYPVKASGWKEVGFFEAKNSREIQAFLVQNPLIWARYLRIEFLTHYGNEYYCPLSLLRVHGITALEEYNHQLAMARGDTDEDTEEVHSEAADISVEVAARDSYQDERVDKRSDTSTTTISTRTTEAPSPSSNGSTAAHISTSKIAFSANSFLPYQIFKRSDGPNTSTTTSKPSTSTRRTTTIHENGKILVPSSTPSVDPAGSAASSMLNKPSNAKQNGNHIDTSSVKQQNVSTSDSKKQTSASTPSSPPPAPTTQESFYKSVHKRLQLLETNATLSLRYIEEQSRLFQDAINKMDKRQLSKAYSYVEQLNSTFLRELQTIRDQYHQLWQSTVMALESQKALSENEIVAVSTRLTILADERMSIIQSILLVVAIGLIIFSKSPYSTLRSSRSALLRLESPLMSPPSVMKTMSNQSSSSNNGSPSPPRFIGHQRQNSDVSLPDFDYPPKMEVDNYDHDDDVVDHAEPIAIRSSPATPRGINSTTKQVSWTNELNEALSASNLDVHAMRSKRWSAPDITIDIEDVIEPFGDNTNQLVNDVELMEPEHLCQSLPSLESQKEVSPDHGRYEENAMDNRGGSTPPDVDEVSESPIPLIRTETC